MRAAWVMTALSIGLLHEPGCNGADSPAGGPNAPCTRSHDCGDALECIEGVCTYSDAGVVPVDATVTDAASPVDASDDGG